MSIAAVFDRSLTREERRDVTIHVRATAQTRDVIDRAAQVAGKTRTDFMLDSALRHAEDVLLDQRLFVLDESRYAEFVRLLDQPARPSAKLRELLARKAPWEK